MVVRHANAAMGVNTLICLPRSAKCSITDKAVHSREFIYDVRYERYALFTLTNLSGYGDKHAPNTTGLSLSGHLEQGDRAVLEWLFGGDMPVAK